MFQFLLCGLGLCSAGQCDGDGDAGSSSNAPKLNNTLMRTSQFHNTSALQKLQLVPHVLPVFSVG
jgi:hypothetical protein